MSGQLEYTPLETDDEAALANAMGGAFNAGAQVVRAWWDKCGRENLRVVRQADRTVGGLIVIPMGHYFGGQRLGAYGVAGVCVLPEVRGQGIAGFLMRSCLSEARANGNPLCSLYASTFALYRSVGFERAGLLLRTELRLRDLPREKPQLTIRAAGADDHAAIEELYRERARATSGFPDRSEYLWRRLRDPRGFSARLYIVADGPEVVGYAVLLSTESDFEHLYLADWAARTPQALQSLRAFLASHGTIFQKLRMSATVDDPLVLSLPERYQETKVQQTWMLRLVDLPSALERRGYPSGMTCELHLDVRDEACPENAGTWVLSIHAGTGKLTAGGTGRIRVGAATLASLYTGFAAAESWRLAGGIEGSPEDLAALSAAFAGPTPSMLDAF